MKYNINNNNLAKLFLDIENNLEEKSGIINELLRIDYKYCKIKTDLQLLKSTLDGLKNEKIELPKQQKIIIKYNGNPCITLNLSILAILTRNIVILDYEDSMIGINSFIMQTVNKVLNDFQTDNLIYEINKKNYEHSNIDKIICIDDINKYNLYLREQNTKARFYSFNYLDFYSDSDEFEEIEQLIHQFAENNKIPIEVYSELDINEAVDMIKNGLGKSVVILTNSEETKQIFEKNITNKRLYINENPFERNIRILNKEIILM